ncbi:unnamed protein product [Onchocerca flexuosa]|uniref:RICTOR_V domain-containing protein n=1 Tax=Onchocerca flexuosa TaxID=387005 RepID=A0A183I6U8_9BILA|nr:unnamed protein product [Onchocerca flexuosa]
MTLQVIPVLLNLMEQGTELVFSTSEIMLAILNEVDDDWRKNMLIGEYLVQDILLMVDELRCDETDEKTVISLATRLHFVCLMWPGIATTYMDVFTEYRLHSVLISVLDMVIIHCLKRPAFIRLIAPICLWLDLYDKMLKLLDSKDKVEKAIESYAWKYWDTDERGGVFTWINYPPAASHTLTNAFLAGRRNCSSNEHKEWNEIVRDRLVSAVIGLLGLSSIDANSIHAIFILAARITRDFRIAREFLQVACSFFLSKRIKEFAAIKILSLGNYYVLCNGFRGGKYHYSRSLLCLGGKVPLVSLSLIIS